MQLFAGVLLHQLIHELQKKSGARTVDRRAGGGLHSSAATTAPDPWLSGCTYGLRIWIKDVPHWQGGAWENPHDQTIKTVSGQIF
jgi:hypothetical protein